MINKLLVSHEELKKEVQADMHLHTTNSNQISDLSSQVQDLRRDVDRIRREKNLFIYNVPESAANDADLLSTLRGFLEKASISLPDWAVDTILRKGRTPGKRPIFVCFNSPTWVHKIFSIATELRKQGVYLENDLAPEQMAQKREAQEAHRALRAAGLGSSLERGKLFVDGKAVPRSDFPTILARARQNTGAHPTTGEIPPSCPSIPSLPRNVSLSVSPSSLTPLLTSPQESLSSTSSAADVRRTADQILASTSQCIPSTQMVATSLSASHGTTDPGIESLLTYAEAVNNEHTIPHLRWSNQSPSMRSRTYKRKKSLPYPKSRKHLKPDSEENCSTSNKITHFLVQMRNTSQTGPPNSLITQQQMSSSPSLPPRH